MMSGWFTCIQVRQCIQAIRWLQCTRMVKGYPKIYIFKTILIVSFPFKFTPTRYIMILALLKSSAPNMSKSMEPTITEPNSPLFLDLDTNHFLYLLLRLMQDPSLLQLDLQFLLLRHILSVEQGQKQLCLQLWTRL